MICRADFVSVLLDVANVIVKEEMVEKLERIKMDKEEIMEKAVVPKMKKFPV